jgi:hypothetical protein
VPQVNGVNSGVCYGSVLLDNELRQSLTAMNGSDVPWIHGCVLDHSHDGDHGAPAYQVDGGPQHWLRWPHSGPARLERVELSAPGRHSGSVSAPPPDRAPSQATTSSDATADRPGADGIPTPGSHDEVLWAIATALERLADAVARLGNQYRDKGID